MEFFVTIEDFKNAYLKKIKKELDHINESIGGNVNHIQNHIKNGEITIEQDFEKITKVLVDHIKLRVRECKSNILTKFRESNKSNLKRLEDLKGKIGNMLDEGNGVISLLNRTLNRQIENNGVLQTQLESNLL